MINSTYPRAAEQIARRLSKDWVYSQMLLQDKLRILREMQARPTQLETSPRLPRFWRKITTVDLICSMPTGFPNPFTD